MAQLLFQTLQLYKKAYSGHPRAVWNLALLTFINRMGTMVIPFLTVYLTTVIGFSLKEAGILAGAFGLGSLGGSYLGGKVSDRIGAHWVIIISLSIGGGLLIALQFATTFIGFLLLIFTTALFGEAYRPAVMTALAECVPKNKTSRSVSLIRLAINLGMSAAPAVGGFVAASLGYKLLFWIDGLTCLVAAVYFVPSAVSWRRNVTEKAVTQETEAATSALPPYKNKPYLLFLLASFLAGFVFMQWFHSVPVFIKSEWGFDERYIGMLLGFSSFLVVLIEMPVIHQVEESQWLKPSIFLGVILIGISFLPFLLPKAWILGFLAILLLTLGEILFLPLNNSRSLNMSPDKKRGEYVAWYWMAWSVTNIIGPTLGLAFADEWGFSVLWLALAGIAGLSLLLNLRLERSDA